jgi:chaperone LolA
MVYKRIVITALSIAISALLSATDMNDFYHQARAKFDSVKTLKADIAQTNEFAKSKTKLQSSGKLYYKPGNLVLDYTKPNIQKLIIKGNAVQLYDANSKTVIRTTNREGISNPLELVDKYWLSSKRELISEDSLSIHMRLIPDKDEYLKKLEVGFERKSMMIKDLTYWDKSGNKVRFRFLNIHTGAVIPDAKWKFIPPKGVKIIQQ